MFRVMIVDDEPHVVESVKLLLQDIEDRELDVYSAHRGGRALEILSSMRVDLLITDIQMPDITGLELIRQAQHRWPDMQAFILTGYSRFEYAYEAIQLGAIGFLLKSEKDDVLIAAVREALEKIEEGLNREQLFLNSHRAPEDASSALDAIFRAPRAQLGPLLKNAHFDAPCSHFAVLCASACAVSLDALDIILSHYLNKHTGYRQYGKLPDDTSTWLIQLKAPLNTMWLNGTLEAVQASVRATTGEDVSFAAGMATPGSLGAVRALLVRSLSQPGETSSIFTLGKGAQPSGGAANTVEFIRRYIDAHLTDDVSMLALSTATGYNPDYLSRVFRQLTGETVGQYISARRMHRIHALMADDALTIEEISRLSGFTSSSYFNRFMKREVGLTPKAYRAMLKQERAKANRSG